MAKRSARHYATSPGAPRLRMGIAISRVLIACVGSQLIGCAPIAARYPVGAQQSFPPNSPRFEPRCSLPGLDIGDYAWVKDPKPEDIKNGGWEVCPGNIVLPATYCSW